MPDFNRNFLPFGTMLAVLFSFSFVSNAQTITHTSSDLGDFEDVNPDKRINNPLHLPIYAPDPSAHVWPDGKVYVYPSRDTPGKGFFDMESWYVFSSEDLVNWTNYGKIFHIDDIEWAKYKAWAPDCAYKDGKYYFYFPCNDWDDKNWVGVATSDSPTGPFTHPSRLVRGVDPHVFVDYEGIYWYAMNGTIQQLADDMISLKGKVYRWSEFTVGFPEYEKYAHEGTWVFKRNGLYYLTSASSSPEPRADGNTQKHVLIYGVSESPTGPFQYKGILMNTIGNSYKPSNPLNNHHSVVKYKGRWVLFHHRVWKGPDENIERAMCANYINFNPDGTIQEVQYTDEGVDFRNNPALNELQDLDFLVSLEESCEHVEARFQYSSHNILDPDSSRWDFGDGSTQFDRFDQGVSHQYKYSGKYTVSLVLWLNGEERTIKKEHLIDFTQNSPIVGFTYDDEETLVAPVNVDFINQTVYDGDDSLNYFWYINASPEAQDSSENLMHLFDSAGNYLVTLIAEDEHACQYSYSDTLTIHAGTASFKEIQASGLNISRNTTGDSVYIIFDEVPEVSHKLEIYNLQGKLLEIRNLTRQVNTLDFSGYNRSSYIFKIFKQGDLLLVHKVFKN